MIPQDPVMLLSYMNTKLRDEYSSFELFCEEEDASAEEIGQKLLSIGYEYDPEQNRFI